MTRIYRFYKRSRWLVLVSCLLVRVSLFAGPLHDAVRAGDLVKVKQLIESGSDVNVVDKENQTPLHWVAKLNKDGVAIATFLLEQGANLHSITSNGDTPLHWAVRNGNGRMDLVLLYVRKGAKVNVPNKYNATPINKAVRSGNAEMVQFLIDNGADCNIRGGYCNNHENHLLHQAVGKISPELVKVLLDAGVDVNVRNKFQMTPLHSAASPDRADIAQLLLAYGADINARSAPTHHSATPVDNVVRYYKYKYPDLNRLLSPSRNIHEAASDGKLCEVKRFIKQGVKVDLQDKNQRTSLHKAAEKGYVKIGEFLLSKGANLEALCNHNYTPLIWSTSRGNKDFSEMLLDKGANIDHKKNSNVTSLHWAVLGGFEDVVQLLVKRGAKKNIKDHKNFTALDYALQKGDSKIISLLQESSDAQARKALHDEDLIALDEKLLAVLDKTTHFDFSEIKSMILKGANINICSGRRNTALHYVILSRLNCNNYIEEVKFLLDHGADVSVQYDSKDIFQLVNERIETIQKFIKNPGAAYNHVSYKKQYLTKLALVLPFLESSKKQQELTFQSTATSTFSTSTIKPTSSTIFQAVKVGNLEEVKKLLAQGTEINIRNSKGSSLLHVAVMFNHIKLVQFLIEQGIDIELVSDTQKTPLHHAAWKGRTEIAKFLIQAGANKVSCDTFKNTPLHLAALHGKIGVAKVLINAGVDRTLKNHKKRTALKIAQTKGNSKIVSLLFKRPSGLKKAKNISKNAISETLLQASDSDFIINHKDIILDDKIGSGGFGDVYKAKWTGQDVAVKKLHMKNMSSESEREFKHETSIWKKLSHPNIVTLFGICVKPDPYCMVMRYKPMGSLYKLLHSQTKEIPWSSRKTLAIDIASALLYLHKKNIQHRDLKSLNVLVSKQDEKLRASLTDFGLSVVKQETATTTKIGAQQSSGTLLWMAPELLRGRSCSKASDIYAYGMVLWELVTRKQPFKGVHSGAIRGLIKDGDLDCLEIPTGTPSEISNLIKQCWNLKPNLRPSAQQILDQLNEEQSSFLRSSAQQVLDELNEEQFSLNSMPAAQLLVTGAAPSKSQSTDLTDSDFSVGIQTSRKILKKLLELRRLLDRIYSEDDDLEEDDIVFRNTTMTFLNSFYGKTKLTVDEKQALADKKQELLDELDSDDEELGSMVSKRFIRTEQKS